MISISDGALAITQCARAFQLFVRGTKTRPGKIVLHLQETERTQAGVDVVRRGTMLTIEGFVNHVQTVEGQPRLSANGPRTVCRWLSDSSLSHMALGS